MISRHPDAARGHGIVSLHRGDRDHRGFWVGLPWQRRSLAAEACAAANDLWFDVLGFPVLRVGKAAANEPCPGSDLDGP